MTQIGDFRVPTLAAIAAALCLAPIEVQAQQSFEGISKEEIFEASIETTSRIKKERARVYLAENFPRSPEGKFAAAWIAGVEGDTEAEARLYLDCLADDPEFEWCLSNYLVDETVQSDKPAVDSALQMFEAMGDDRYKANTFQNLLSSLRRHGESGKQQARALLEQHRGRMDELGLAWKYALLKGLEASANSDTDRSIEFYEEAIALGADDFAPWQYAADARREQVTPAELQRSRRLLNDVITPIADKLRDNPQDVEAVVYIAEFFKDMGDRDRAAQFYRMAFEIEPQPEFAREVRNNARDPQMTSEWLAMARVRSPDDPYVQIQNGLHAIDFGLDFELGSQLIEEALPRMASDRLRRDAAATYAYMLEEYEWNWDKALDFRQRYGALPTERTSNLISNRFRSGDLDAARRFLEIGRDQGRLNADYVALYQTRLNRAEAEYRGRAEAGAYLDFLDRWSGAEVPRTGAAERTVLFGRGSAQLSRAAMAEIDSMAKLIKSHSEIADVIEVSGFAEFSEIGTADLATARAEAVRERLIAQSGIPGERFDIVVPDPSLGISAPVGNARVTVIPLSSFGESRILPPLAQGTRSFSATPDGRFVMSGLNSGHITDLATGRIVTEVGESSSSKFSPNGRLVALRSSATDSGGFSSTKIHIFDRLTGVTVHSFLFENSAHGPSELVWHPDSNSIAYVTQSGTATLLDLETQTRRWTVRVFDRFIAGRLAFSPDGSTLAIGPSQSREVVLVDSDNGEQLRRLGGVDWPRGMNWSNDGTLLVVADNRYDFHVWDTRTWQKREGSLPGHPNRRIDIDQQNRFAYVDISVTNDGETTRQIAKVDLSSLDTVERFSLKNPSYDFNWDASRITLTQGKIRVLDTQDFSETASIELATTRLTYSAAPKDCQCFVTLDDNGLHVWNATTGRLQHSFGEVPDSFAVTDDGKSIFGIVKERLVHFDLFTFETRDYGAALIDGGIAQIIKAKGDIIAIGGVVSPSENSAMVEVRRLSDLRLINRIDLSVVTEVKRFPGLYHSEISSLQIDPDQQRVAVITRWQDGYGKGWTTSHEARVFDVANGELAFRVRRNRELDWVSFSEWEGQPSILTPRGAFIDVFSADGEYLKWINRNDFKKRGTLDGREFTLVRTGSYSLEIDWIDDGRDPIDIPIKVDIDDYYSLADLNLLVLVNKDNSFTFHDLTTGERTLTIVAQQDSEWLAYTPSGLYAASLNGAERASLAFGSVVRPLAAHAERLESRKLVSQKLASVRTGRIEDELAQAEVAARNASLTAPYRLKLLDLPSQTGTKYLSVDFQVTKTDPSAPDPVLSLTLNGHRQDISLTGQLGADGKYTHPFPLLPGRNFIQAAIAFNGGDYGTVTAMVNRNTGEQAVTVEEQELKPRLFYLGIGVSKYADPEMDLQFAHKDVEMVAKELEAQEGTLFREVRQLVLTDEDAANEVIRTRGLREFLGGATDQDVIVIYLAGHGAQDIDGLYFLTHDTDFNKPYEGFEMAQISRFLRRRPQGQKAILLMDMCRAGSLDFLEDGARATTLGGVQRVTGEDVGNALKGSGTIVFASSNGSAPSYESADWEGGHGAFTAAVLRGLRGEAEAIGDRKDGQVDVLEMVEFVSKTVPELTGARKQQPTVVGAIGFSTFALTKPN